MLVTGARQLPVGDGWTYEVKWNGYRTLALKGQCRRFGLLPPRQPAPFSKAELHLSDQQFVLLALAVAVIIYLATRLSSATATINDLTSKMSSATATNNHLTSKMNALALQQFNAWKKTELESVKRQATEAASGEAELNLHYWKLASEKSIRADAHHRSKAVTTGKVLEHMAPHLPEFPYNPKDARFIGSPVDYVVFDGLDDGVIRQVVFVEVKTGDSALTARQKRIKEVIESNKVKWYDLRISDCVTPQLNAPAPQTRPRPISATTRSQVVLPELGDVTNEATIVRWLVRPGARVAAGEPLLEVESDKCIIQLPAPASGRLLGVYAATGKVVRVGSVIGEIDTLIRAS